MDALRPRPQRRAAGGASAAHGWAGTILDDAESATDRVRVRLEAFADGRQFFGPMAFVPRGSDAEGGGEVETWDDLVAVVSALAAGGVLPSAGDPCKVLADESGELAIYWWEPA